MTLYRQFKFHCSLLSLVHPVFWRIMCVRSQVPPPLLFPIPKRNLSYLILTRFFIRQLLILRKKKGLEQTPLFLSFLFLFLPQEFLICTNSRLGCRGLHFWYWANSHSSLTRDPKRLEGPSLRKVSRQSRQKKKFGTKQLIIKNNKFFTKDSYVL